MPGRHRGADKTTGQDADIVEVLRIGFDPGLCGMAMTRVDRTGTSCDGVTACTWVCWVITRKLRPGRHPRVRPIRQPMRT
jgi:hypothetical protein